MTEDLLAEVARLKRESGCPCCHGTGKNSGIDGSPKGDPCSECKGGGLAIVAYECLRVHYKLQGEEIAGLKYSLAAAKAEVERLLEWAKSL